jgi:hypothetical protein
VEVINRPSVSRAGLTPKRVEDVLQSPHNRLPYGEATIRLWWDSVIDDGKPGYLETLKDERWDAVLVDGCEFAGFDDYTLVRDRADIIFLDDVFSAYKCSHAHEALDWSPQWTCIWMSRLCRNGASIWVRR